LFVTTPLLRLRDVGVTWPNGTSAFSHVDLEVGAGERVCIMGPSGSGKSTLLGVCGGLVHPTTGSIERERVSPADVAWVFQETFFLGFRSVRDNVALAAFIRQGSWSRALVRASPVLAAVGLLNSADLAASTISGGERQRLGVARALASNCPLILADEPTASLDGALVESVARLLVGSPPRQCAVVVATHDPRVAALCGSVFRLDNGGLVAC
jgi:ABC-type lipoprotein export system ATPase subunit